MTHFNFSQVVTVHDGQIGIVVKCWENETYDVYVRSYSVVVPDIKGSDIRHYQYSKSLDD